MHGTVIVNTDRSEWDPGFVFGPTVYSWVSDVFRYTHYTHIFPIISTGLEFKTDFGTHVWLKMFFFIAEITFILILYFST